MKSKEKKQNLLPANHTMDEELLLEAGEMTRYKMPIQCIWQIIYYGERRMNNVEDEDKEKENDEDKITSKTGFFYAKSKLIHGEETSIKRMFFLTDANKANIGKISSEGKDTKKLLLEELDGIIPPDIKKKGDCSKELTEYIIDLMRYPVAAAENEVKNAKNKDKAKKDLAIVRKYFSLNTLTYYRHILEKKGGMEAFNQMVDEAFDCHYVKGDFKMSMPTELMSDSCPSMKNQFEILQKQIDTLPATPRQSSEKTIVGDYGELKNLQGEADVKYDDGSTYTGGWKYGNREGYGIYTSADGSQEYTGDWVCDVREGRGRYVNKDKADEYEYIGEWKNDRMNGTGTLKQADGEVYSGEWIEGEFVEGEIKTPGGLFYKGQVKNGYPEGEGILKTPTGITIEGTFIHMDINGHGTVTFPDGSSIEGIWKAPIAGLYEKEDLWHPSDLQRPIRQILFDDDGSFGGGYVDFEYDDNGKVKKLSYYDAQGKLEKDVEYDDNGKVQKRSRYDAQGKLIKAYEKKSLSKHILDILFGRDKKA